jgi:undecaprenyl diphosphate synthase
LPREAGHRAGVETVSRIVEAAPGAGIGILSLFAFSSDNWRRPRPEVEALMRLLARLPGKRGGPLPAQRRPAGGDRPPRPPEWFAAGSHRAGGADRPPRARLWLRIAFDYSGRDAILAAARASAVSLASRWGARSGRRWTC